MADERGKPRPRGFSWQSLDSAFPFGSAADTPDHVDDDAVDDAVDDAQPDAVAAEPPDAAEAFDEPDPPSDLTGVFLNRDEAAPPPAPPPARARVEKSNPSASAAPTRPQPQWPTRDDRLAAVRKLIPRAKTEDVIPPARQEAALPEPPPEPRRSSASRRPAAPAKPAEPSRPTRRFRPQEPQDLDEAGLPDGLVEGLVAKHLYNAPGASGRALAYDIGLRNTIVTRILEDFKMRRLCVHRSAAAMGDFYYELTEEGRSMARELLKDSRYAGPAPVPLTQYVESVKAQAISTEKPKMPQLRGAFADLAVPDAILNRIGPAVTHGKGLFMYGPPGNGKTSLAERITRAYGSTVYLPYAIYAGGHIIQVFDPAVHFPVDESDIHPGMSNRKLDRRWLRCRRPTVIVGGELTLESLDIAFDEIEGICEAPIQVKANCGTLVIDDFGRQRCQPDELLNRWIVPLEKQVDYIALPGGRKETFPFECLLVFSTNMEPKDLVDEAFLRRIPYKLEISDPDENAFRGLLNSQSASLGLQLQPGVVDYLINTHFKAANRPMRFCHPRDLMLQVSNLRRFREEEMIVDRESVDEAVLLYFSLL